MCCFQVHDVPELYRKKPLTTKLGASIGEVLRVDKQLLHGRGYYVHLRVWLDTRKSLVRFVSFQPNRKAQVIMGVKYKKIPHFCVVCGFLVTRRSVAPGSILRGRRGK
jgi:hypothetical protein